MQAKSIRAAIDYIYVDHVSSVAVESIGCTYSSHSKAIFGSEL